MSFSTRRGCASAVSQATWPPKELPASTQRGTPSSVEHRGDETHIALDAVVCVRRRAGQTDAGQIEADHAPLRPELLAPSRPRCAGWTRCRAAARSEAGRRAGPRRADARSCPAPATKVEGGGAQRSLSSDSGRSGAQVAATDRTEQQQRRSQDAKPDHGDGMHTRRFPFPAQASATLPARPALHAACCPPT